MRARTVTLPLRDGLFRRNVRASAAVQLGVCVILNVRRPHLLDLIMQGLYIKTQSSPFEAPYFSCVPYLMGEGQAMMYSFWPVSPRKTPIPRLPLRPPDDYLRNAMVAALDRYEVEIDVGDRCQGAVANRRASHADRTRGGAVAGAPLTACVGGHIAHPPTTIQFARADGVRQATVVQPLALPR